MAMRNAGTNEVAGFGITKGTDPLFIEDFVLVKHHATAVTFEFDDEAMAQFQGEMFAKGIYPDQCRRITCHTHPGQSAEPSHTDMKNFEEHYENMDWCCMVILAHGGNCTATLRVRTVPDAHEGSNQACIWVDKPLKVMIKGQVSMDQLSPKELSELPWKEWMEEYERCNLDAPSKHNGGMMWQGKEVSKGNKGNSHVIAGTWVPGIESANKYVAREVAVAQVIDHLKTDNRDRVVAAHFAPASNPSLIRPPYTQDPIWYGIDSDNGKVALEGWTRDVRSELMAEKIVDFRMEAWSHLVNIDCVDRLIYEQMGERGAAWARPMENECWDRPNIKKPELYQARFKLTDDELKEIQGLTETERVDVHIALQQMLHIGIWGQRTTIDDDDISTRLWVMYLVEEDRKRDNLAPLETLRPTESPKEPEPVPAEGGGFYDGE